MNDLRHPCEHWAEPISLAAAGCLSADEEREVRRHIETCSDCRERFRQLTAVVRRAGGSAFAGSQRGSGHRGASDVGRRVRRFGAHGCPARRKRPVPHFLPDH